MKICLVRVALTEQGRAQIEDWRRRKREALTDLLSVLDEDEQRNLQDMIERVLEAANARGRFEESNEG
jgi:DNA-binding MarR family transcriptional regulator